jgi:pseudaminic acid biosynthesis-associated methylase
MKTEQEQFWEGDFGNSYTDRVAHPIAPQINLFSKILSKIKPVNSVFEIGTNRGMNLDAIRTLLPDIETNGIEINKYASEIAQGNNHNVQLCSILDYAPENKYDLVFTRGVLIHINPEYLKAVYQKIYDSSSNYILIDEYFNPTPVTVEYRGNNDRLFKRDFAKELMEEYSLTLIDYGFTWKQDPFFPLDDTNWFLFKK